MPPSMETESLRVRTNTVQKGVYHTATGTALACALTPRKDGRQASEKVDDEEDDDDRPPLCSSKSLPSYTPAEVALHDQPDDAWMIYRDKVLDVTKWMASHPGGEQTLLRFAGMDATDEIRAFHADWVLAKRVPSFVVGTVKEKPEDSELVRDFRQLGVEFEKLGYFRGDPSFYRKEAAVFAALYSTVWGLVVGTESTFAHLVAAVLLGFFWQQFAFVGHDCGHASSADKNSAATVDLRKHSHLVTYCLGISIGWWNATHNVHHAVPNTIDCDPDIAHLPVFAIDKTLFGSLYNKYHRKVMPFDWFARNVFVPYQHFWYYPIMSVARFNLYIQSLVFYLASSPEDGHSGRSTKDLYAFVGHFVWLSALVACVPGLAMKVAFVLLSHAVAGILNVQITLSHFSQPVFTSCNCDDADTATTASAETDSDADTVTDETSISAPALAVGLKYGGDFYTRNVLSSVDISCHPLLDRIHGGLQFQTLHHLYPRIARHHLRKTELLIAALCKKHDLPYEQMSFLECNLDVIRTLRNAAEEARSWSPLIFESMCAEG